MNLLAVQGQPGCRSVRNGIGVTCVCVCTCECEYMSVSVVLVTTPPYSEPLKDLVNYTVTEIMESCTQCHYTAVTKLDWPK